MNNQNLDAFCSRQLHTLEQKGLHRAIRPLDSAQSTRTVHGNRPLLNFSSNDYLGLASHPALAEAATQAARDYGAGSGASRLVCGSLPPHHALEEAIAGFKNTEAAIAFSSGYATAMGTIPALLGKNDCIILDKLCHACLVDAARLSGATLRVFPHNNLDQLENRLRWARKHFPNSNLLVATEAVFSMDGDAAPLAEILEIKERYGAWLMVDEAHSVGVQGTHGEGLSQSLGVAHRVDIQMGTLGKALGASGGYISGSRPLVDLLVNQARSFIYSTAPPPAAAAAATAAINLLQSSEGSHRIALLQNRIRQLEQHFPNLPSPHPSAIFPWFCGSNINALQDATSLLDQGFLVPAIRYPTVPKNTARLRVTLSSAHSQHDVELLVAALASLPPGNS